MDTFALQAMAGRTIDFVGAPEATMPGSSAGIGAGAVVLPPAIDFR